jgi:hypothetical protein
MLDFNVPVEMIFKKKGKTSKRLLSFNLICSFINPFQRNKFKQDYHEFIIKHLPQTEQIKGKYRIEYRYFYKKENSDGANVISILSKSLNDTLVELEIVEEDNVKFCIGESWEVAKKVKKEEEAYVNVKVIGV